MKLFITGIAVLVMATFLVTTVPNLVKAQTCRNSAEGAFAHTTFQFSGVGGCGIGSLTSTVSGPGFVGAGAAVISNPPSATVGVANGPNSASANAGTSSASASTH